MSTLLIVTLSLSAFADAEGRGSIRDPAGRPAVAPGPPGVTAHSTPLHRASPGRTQTSVVDAGSFTVLEGAAKVGREVFSIRRAPPPDGGFLSDGAAVYSARRFVPTLRTDTGGGALRYQVETSIADHRQELVTLQVTRGHGSERVQTPRGESATEFIVAPGTWLLDDDVFAQDYFIARAVIQGRLRGVTEAQAIPIIIPRRGAPISGQVSVIGDDRVDVAGVSRSAIHLRIAAGSGNVRDVWADSEGRVLRVAIPARRLVAVRDEMPP